MIKDKQLSDYFNKPIYDVLVKENIVNYIEVFKAKYIDGRLWFYNSIENELYETNN